jgi:hypothetical protein
MSETLTADQRVAAVREFVARVFNEHRPDRAREYLTPDIVWRSGSLGRVSEIDNVGWSPHHVHRGTVRPASGGAGRDRE